MTESSVNPYAAPDAAVADIAGGDPGVQPVKLWSAKGRIGRVRFLAYTLYAYLLFLVMSFVLAGIAGFLATLGNVNANLIVSLVALLTLFPYLVFHVLVGIQRSHDMDWSGWMLLLAVIPLAALIWLFKPGTQGSNRFGAPPPPNTTSVLIGAWLLPVLVLIIIALIVAGEFLRPAYQ